MEDKLESYRLRKRRQELSENIKEGFSKFWRMGIGDGKDVSNDTKVQVEQVVSLFVIDFNNIVLLLNASIHFRCVLPTKKKKNQQLQQVLVQMRKMKTVWKKKKVSTLLRNTINLRFVVISYIS